MKFTPLASRITRRVEMQHLDPMGPSVPLPADLIFDPSDPLAATITFHTGAGAVPWTFGRELLAFGRHRRAGMGDVRVWPGVDDGGSSAVVIQLRTPDTTVAVRVGAGVLDEFVEAMFASVPPGKESIDLDSELADLLR